MEKILLAVNKSEHSLKAYEVTMKLVNAFNANLVLFMVIEEQPLTSYYELGINVEKREKNLQGQLAYCKSHIHTLEENFKKANISVTSKIARGIPSEEIIKEVSKGNYSLVVLGSRNLTGIKKLFLGTVSQKVANHVNCSVLVVK